MTKEEEGTVRQKKAKSPKEKKQGTSKSPVNVTIRINEEEGTDDVPIALREEVVSQEQETEPEKKKRKGMFCINPHL